MPKEISPAAFAIVRAWFASEPKRKQKAKVVRLVAPVSLTPARAS